MIKRTIKKSIKKIAPGMTSRLTNYDAKFVEIYNNQQKIMDTTNEALETLKSYVPDTRMDVLKKSVESVEAYQPIYNISGINESRRNTGDRANAIYNYFKKDVSALKVLDIGCSLGFIDFYLSDRGAEVEGWDYSANNINVCKSIQDINGLPVKFKVKSLTTDTSMSINPGQFDVVIILSVIHHLITHQGLKETQKILSDLLDRIPILVVELAKKGEDKNLFWDKYMPKDELDVFINKEHLNIEKIGEFDTHLSRKKRPLYVITKKYTTVGKHKYAIENMSFRPYSDSPDWRPISANYSTGGDHFIKRYNISLNRLDSKKQIINEINTYLQLSDLKIKGIPELLDFEINDDLITLVLKKIDGVLLDEAVRNKQSFDYEKIIFEVINILTSLESIGLYHNDLRTWNIMLTTDDPYIIDFGTTSSVQEESKTISLLWLINSILTGKRESYTQSSKAFPPRVNFESNKYFTSLYDAVVENEKISFLELGKLKRFHDK